MIVQLEQVQELELKLVRAQEWVLVLQLEQAPALQPEQVLESALVQELQLERALVWHLPHQPLQSRFQLQRSHLLQHEFLSILQQLVKALQYQLCL